MDITAAESHSLNPHRCELYPNDNINLANGVNTKIPWAAATYDPHGAWSALNPTRITIPAGFRGARLSCMLGIPDLEPVEYYALYYIDGVGEPPAGSVSGKSSGASSDNTIHMTLNSPPLERAAGTYFEVNVLQSSTGDQFLVQGDNCRLVAEFFR